MNQSKRSLEFATKIGCIIDCSFCPQKLFISNYNKTSKTKDIEMSLDNFKKIINKVPENVEIRFAGMSEPFLHQRCTDMILYAHQSHHEIAVFTTIVGLSVEEIDRFKTIGFNDFVIHLPDNNSYSKIPINEKYLLVLEKIFQSNIKGLRLSSHGKIPKILNPLLDKYGYGSFKEYQGDEIHDRGGSLQIQDNAKSNSLINGPIACPASGGQEIKRNLVLPDGTVSFCCMDMEMNHILGNLLNDSYESLFLNDAFKSLRKLFNSNSSDFICRKCIYVQRYNLYFKFKRFFYTYCPSFIQQTLFKLKQIKGTKPKH